MELSRHSISPGAKFKYEKNAGVNNPTLLFQSIRGTESFAAMSQELAYLHKKKSRVNAG